MEKSFVSSRSRKYTSVTLKERLWTLQYKVCSTVSDAKSGRIEIRPAIPFIPEYTVDSETTDENNDDFIAVTCSLMPCRGVSRKIIM